VWQKVHGFPVDCVYFMLAAASRVLIVVASPAMMTMAAAPAAAEIMEINVREDICIVALSNCSHAGPGSLRRRLDQTHPEE
jgi:hypothetical protein